MEQMNKNQKKCLISKLNYINKKINNTKNEILNLKKDEDLLFLEWLELELILLNNQKIIIEKALINDWLEEL